MNHILYIVKDRKHKLKIRKNKKMSKKRKKVLTLFLIFGILIWQSTSVVSNDENENKKSQKN